MNGSWAFVRNDRYKEFFRSVPELKKCSFARALN